MVSYSSNTYLIDEVEFTDVDNQIDFAKFMYKRLYQ